MSVQFEEARPVVVVIDDDDDVREALDSLFRSVGFLVESFSSGRQFLETERPNDPGCMVLDVRLPGQNGLDFHDELIKSRLNQPVVFISGHADVPMSVRAMKAGAVEFLTKPVRDQDLLDAVNLAIEKDRVQRHRAREAATVWRAYKSLTPREREVMALAAQGARNRQIACELDLSEATIKFHRANLMEKMRARSPAELMRMADTLGIANTKARPT